MQIFSGLNNFQEYSVLDEKYSGCLGFTDSEINELLNKSPLGKNEEEKQRKNEEIKLWYNGYKIGRYVVYNPFLQ